MAKGKKSSSSSSLTDVELLEQLDSMLVADLKEHLKARGLSYVGRKAELVERLRDHLYLNNNQPAQDDEDNDEEQNASLVAKDSMSPTRKLRNDDEEEVQPPTSPSKGSKSPIRGEQEHPTSPLKLKDSISPSRKLRSMEEEEVQPPTSPSKVLKSPIHGEQEHPTSPLKSKVLNSPSREVVSEEDEPKSPPASPAKRGVTSGQASPAKSPQRQREPSPAKLSEKLEAAVAAGDDEDVDMDVDPAPAQNRSPSPRVTSKQSEVTLSPQKKIPIRSFSPVRDEVETELPQKLSSPQRSPKRIQQESPPKSPIAERKSPVRSAHSSPTRPMVVDSEPLQFLSTKKRPMESISHDDESETPSDPKRRRVESDERVIEQEPEDAVQDDQSAEGTPYSFCKL
jgi:hypothetical protein